MSANNNLLLIKVMDSNLDLSDPSSRRADAFVRILVERHQLFSLDDFATLQDVVNFGNADSALLLTGPYELTPDNERCLSDIIRLSHDELIISFLVCTHMLIPDDPEVNSALFTARIMIENHKAVTKITHFQLPKAACVLMAKNIGASLRSISDLKSDFEDDTLNVIPKHLHDILDDSTPYVSPLL